MSKHIFLMVKHVSWFKYDYIKKCIVGKRSILCVEAYLLSLWLWKAISV